MIAERILSAPLHEGPFRYLTLENVFPSERFQEVYTHLYEGDEWDLATDERHGGRSFKRAADCTERIKRIFEYWPVEMIGVLVTKFGIRLIPGKNYMQTWTVSRDQPGYHLLPHIDSDDQILSVLFYMSPTMDHGTVVYDKGHTERFTVPFIQNSLLAFAWGPESWHGVKPVTAQRDTITWVLRHI